MLYVRWMRDVAVDARFHFRKWRCIAVDGVHYWESVGMLVNNIYIRVNTGED